MCLGNGGVSLIAGKQQKEKERQHKFEDFEEDAKEDGREFVNLSLLLLPKTKKESLFPNIKIPMKENEMWKTFFWGVWINRTCV